MSFSCRRLQSPTVSSLPISQIAESEKLDYDPEDHEGEHFGLLISRYDKPTLLTLPLPDFRRLDGKILSSNPESLRGIPS